MSVTESFKQRYRHRYGGVSWQNPAVAAVLPIVDVADRAARRRNGLSHLPPYSARIRASGMGGEFGGGKFAATGEHTKQSLIEHAGLTPTSRVLEVGCGTGRTATALVGYLPPGNFVGFDIDQPQIRAAQECGYLTGFDFFWADATNGMYHATGSTSAADYRFPFEDESFDLVFLASVYTHLLEDDAENYAHEITRVLRRGGTAFVSAFLKDWCEPTQPHRFSHRVGRAWVEYAETPEKIVAYDVATMKEWFPGASPLRGAWRGSGAVDIDEWQDWVRAVKP